jgi:predicted acylesterase/phospholipase RssA
MSKTDQQQTALPEYTEADFQGEKPLCDLIMKGGITSGVVYPYAITELATRYRLRSIGGTSAGAIAAGIAAAAEYGRENGGFVRIAEIPDELSAGLLSMFQPGPRYRAVFRTFIAGLGDRTGTDRARSLLIAALRNHWRAALIGFLPGAVLITQGIAQGFTWLSWLVTLLVAALGPLLAVVTTVVVRLVTGLPKSQFGICPGLRQPDQTAPGLTEWISDTLERVSGRWDGQGPRPERPLTFGDLQEKEIDLNVMTSNLSMRRPVRLPANLDGFCWTRADFGQLFPEWILTYLASVSPKRPLPECPEAYRFPDPDDLPVVVAVRMSLSFPILLTAVPLYTQDFTYRLSEEEQRKARRCWFSDGGISSNFPIHFFDNLWPSRPTFAISLDQHHPARHGPENDLAQRVHMPVEAGSGILIPVREIDGLLSFASSILGTAKDWQDVMQSVLSGYRERIAHIALTEQEGGLNLTMPEDRIRRLTHFGCLAGRAMHDFDFDEHRWRRYLVALARIEETLHKLTANYEGGYRQFLQDYAEHAKSYDQPAGWLEEALKSTDALMTIAAKTSDNPLHTRGKIPKPDTDMRISPKI